MTRKAPAKPRPEQTTTNPDKASFPKSARGARRNEPLIIESDMPYFTALAGWERELLLPLVSPLLNTLFSSEDRDEQADDE